MNSFTDCDRMRLSLMAAFDGETDAGVADPGADARRHAAFCSSCDKWLQDLESMNSRFQGVSYPAGQRDLWASVQARFHESEAKQSLTYSLSLIGALVLGWRVLQLLIDLPFPFLHPVAPLAGAIAAFWVIARDPFAIETYAPELEKRGV